MHIFGNIFAKLESDMKYTYTIGDMAFFRQYYMDELDEEF